MKQDILSVLPGDHPWQNSIYYHDTLPSTNTTAKELAAKGAPEGTVVIAGTQTAGRGRLGRSFHAPEGLGVYLSAVLRPNCKPQDLMHLTCCVAEAVCDAVEQAAHLRPQIKWTNDLVVGSKKLGGILTELSVDSTTGLVQWAIVGIGLNCCHQKEDFPAQLQDMATSLAMCGVHFSPATLAGHMILALHRMRSGLFSQKQTIMERYKSDCMTLGQQVVLLRGEEKRYGTALDLTDDGSLIVRFQDGKTETVSSGEISVRGLYGYV